MHDGCTGSFQNGKQVVDKVRAMGFNIQAMPAPLKIKCIDCNETFEMEKFEDKCPNCSMVYAVTPCHSHDPAHVQAAGKNY